MNLSIQNLGLNLRHMIDGLGINANLELCLDAGFVESYNGGQLWVDLASGSGLDYTLGTSIGVNASDPSFSTTGVVGAMSANEYFFSPGGAAYFSPDGSTTFDNNWHKNNAAWTVAALLWRSPSNIFNIVGNFTTFANHGIIYWLKSDGTQSRQRGNGSGSLIETNGTATTRATSGQWNFVAHSIDEAAGNAFFQLNGATESINGTFASPSVNSPETSLAIGNNADGGSNPMPTNDAIAMLAAWNRALTTTETTNLYNEIKKRFTTI